MGERQHQAGLDSSSRDQGETLVQGRQQSRRITRPQQLDRVRVEGHGKRRGLARSRSLHDVRQDSLVTDVDTIEIPNADDRTPRRVVVS
jgi:hypothetical protein